MLLSARGKINWALAVTGRREDGYHTLDMLLQSVTLEDGLEILPAESLTAGLRPAAGDGRGKQPYTQSGRAARRTDGMQARRFL